MTLYGSPVPSSKSRRPYVTAIAIVIAVLACVGAIAAAADAANPRVATAPRAAMAPRAEVTPPVRPAPSIAFRGSARHRMGMWARGGGSAYLARISADIGAEGAAAGHGDFTGTRSACQRLMRDVADARAYGPVPVESLQKSWASALGHLGAAAEDCVSGIDKRDSGRLGAAGTELTMGAADAGTVTAAIPAG